MRRPTDITISLPMSPEEMAWINVRRGSKSRANLIRSIIWEYYDLLSEEEQEPIPLTLFDERIPCGPPKRMKKVKRVHEPYETRHTRKNKETYRSLWRPGRSSAYK